MDLMILFLFLTFTMVFANENSNTLGILKDRSTLRQYEIKTTKIESDPQARAQIFAVELLRQVLDIETQKLGGQALVPLSRAKTFQTLFEQKMEKLNLNTDPTPSQMKKVYEEHGDEVALRKLRTVLVQKMSFHSTNVACFQFLMQLESYPSDETGWETLKTTNPICASLKVAVQNFQKTVSNLEVENSETSSIEKSLIDWIQNGDVEVQGKLKRLAILSSIEELQIYRALENVKESVAFMPIAFEHPQVQRKIREYFRQEKLFEFYSRALVDFLQNNYEIKSVGNLDSRMKEFKIWVPKLFELYGRQIFWLITSDRI